MKETLPSTFSENTRGDSDETVKGRPYQLHVLSDAGVQVLALRQGHTLRVGRRRDADIVIDHPSASRDHALLHVAQPPELEDLGSTNGTRVDGQRIEPRRRVPLRPGSLASIGGTHLLVRYATVNDEAGAPRLRNGPVSASGLEQPLVVEDPRTIELYQLAARVAQSNMTVLIQGETGAGKELLAERLHAHSPRRERPFLRVNCAALAEGVLASELFGHERGAFTGAHALKVGLFEAAHGGTVLLDEVGELSLETQAKLLRVLETGEVTRVGSHQVRHVDVRVLSATNRELRELVSAQRFRPDLWYRLNGITLLVPPLRERRRDILPLAHFFALRCAELMAAAPKSFSEEAESSLLRYRWPGNVRELKNVVERAVVLADHSTLRPCDFLLDGLSALEPPSSVPSSQRVTERLGEPSRAWPPRSGDSARGTEGLRFDTALDARALRSRPASRLRASRRAEQLREELQRAERERILEALQQAGNQAAAAKLLGISRRALLYRLDAFGIPRPRKKLV